VTPFFPKWTNTLPAMALTGAVGTLALVIGVVWYYFTPKYWEVGYMPRQPVAYSHQLHAGTLGIDCRYCHSDIEQSKYANIPSTTVCMNCHTLVDDKTGYLAKAMTQNGTDPSPHWVSADLQTLRAAHDSGNSVPWRKVHKLPDYAHFQHAAHINAGVSCYSCHKRIDQMPIVYQSEPLSMGWCLECHRAPETQLVDRSQASITDLGAVERLLADPQYASTTGIRLAQNVNPPQNCGACHY
jgi:hypothetical protein